MLRTWLDSMGGDFIGLTGDLAKVKAAAKSLGIMIEDPVVNADGTVTSTHGAQVLAFLPSDDKAHVLYLSGTEEKTYEHDLPLLAKGSRREAHRRARRLPPGRARGAVLATALGGGAILVACGAGGQDGAADGPARLTVADSYIPLPPAGGMAAGYLTVRNDGGRDELVGVSSPGAGSITMHRSTASSMEQVARLDVPAHGALQLARGGNHLMIMGWQKAPPSVTRSSWT
ncbi:copper chaperone PCu(A)C [Kitasatospora aburaviensis]